MNVSLVSIIIPAFNRAGIIKETLDSISNQTYSDWECIVVDDGSNDDTYSVIESFSRKDPRIKGFKRPETKPKGANACRNYGLSLAKGKYVIFFDSDDIMATTCLEQRVKLFSEHQDKDLLVFSMGVFRDATVFEVYPHRKVINLSLEETLEDFILSDTLPWNVCRPIFKTDLIQNKIAFNEKIHNFQDEEFNIRLLGFLKPKYLSIDNTDCYYRFDEASINKYNSLKGTQDIVNCFYEFYNSVFSVFSQEQKVKHSKKLLLKFFNHIRFYVIPGIDKTEVYKTLELFQNELKLSVKDKAILTIMILLNKFYFNKKGYHFLTTNLKKFL